MSSIALEGNILRLKNQVSHALAMPEKPSLVPYEAKSNDTTLAFSATHAKSLKLLTFSGSGFFQQPHLKLEAKFIRELKRSKNAIEKAGLADLLGRAHSMNAVPELLKLLSTKEDVEVRTIAARSLGTIGNSTHEDSFTRSTLASELIAHYHNAKKLVTAGLEKSTGTSVNEKLQADEAHTKNLNELHAILEAVGSLNVASGSSFLKTEYQDALFTSKENHRAIGQLMHATRTAELELINELETAYEKPISKIKNDLQAGEYESMLSQQPLTTATGETMTVSEAVATIQQLQRQRGLANEMLENIIIGMAYDNSPETSTVLRNGLTARNPVIKALSLEILGERSQLHYGTEIFPNLSHDNEHVREAALSALFYSNEKPAKQKLIELLNTETFFQTMKTPLTQDSLDLYVGFLNEFAENGNKYINMLTKLATKKDFDLQSRKMAILVMSMMTREPSRNFVSEETFKRASKTLEALSLNPKCQSHDDQEALSLFATRLWLGVKDPKAISKALKLVETRMRTLPVEQQEDMLVAINNALQLDPQIDNHENRIRKTTLNLLKESTNPTFSAEAIETLEKNLQPGIREKMGSLEPSIILNKKPMGERIDSTFVAQVRKDLDQLRPILHEMLGHKASPAARMVAAQILGNLGDNNDNTIKRLIENTRNPLQGIIDWDQDPAFYGDPSRYGANIRVNNIAALGRIGDARALGVMLDAMEDPVLKSYVIGPLGDIAKDVNRTTSAADIKKANNKLLSILTHNDTTRQARALRISAAGTLYKFKGGVEAIKQFISSTDNPNFARHAIAGLVINDYALDPSHKDHALVRPMLQPELGVEKLHQQGLTGKGIDIAVIDGGYVDKGNKEAFQNRVKLPARASNPEHYHPTMVATTAAGNGKIVGVAPDSVIYSDKWPELDGDDPMEGYKKLIAGKLRGENNIKVINNSWGLTNNAAIIYKDVRHILKEFKKLVDMAEKADVQIVFSAGNEGEGLGFPSVGTLSLFGLDIDKLTAESKKDLDYILDKVILVGASNTQGLEDKSKHEIAEFSSLGDSLNKKIIPTVLAPGVDMMVYSWDQGDRPKDLVNGTSFSGPYVSGLIALMFQANPKLKPAQIREILTSTAVKLPDLPDTVQGFGEVDPHAAIAKAQSAGRKKA